MKKYLSILFFILLPLAAFAGPFSPYETIPLSASTTSASATFGLSQSGDFPNVMVSNAGPANAFISFTGTAAVPGSSVVNATPVLAGETMVLTKGGALTVSAITATGNATVYFTSGSGN
jgi:hypothetical protein